LSVQARSTVVEHYSTELIATRLGDILRAYR